MMVKRVVIALSMLGLAATALAGAPGNNMVIPSGVDLIAPSSTGTWSFGLEALYMQSNSTYQYAPPAGLDVDTVIQNKDVGNDWNWGVEGDISYMFAGSSRDISLSYTHIDFSDSDSINTTPLPPIIGVGTDTGHMDQQYNNADLTFGQLFTVGNRVSLHPFGGVQFADIDNTDKSSFSVPFTIGDDTSILNINDKIHSDFVGAGPRAGMDGSVQLGSGFSIVGTMAGALLVGNMDAKVTQVASFLGASATAEVKPDSYTAVVPELDAKLGLDYMYAFNPTISMNAQVGYQVVNYFNAVDNDLNDIASVNSVNNTTDFNYHGPYFRLQVNVA